ncbi:hypothetical protein M127_5748 [Bacteroides fragilis str. S6L5]|nr:hypothetical protein M127_5748 [Bacteroides fragilis str. S6L5]
MFAKSCYAKQFILKKNKRKGIVLGQSVFVKEGEVPFETETIEFEFMCF